MDLYYTIFGTPEERRTVFRRREIIKDAEVAARLVVIEERKRIQVRALGEIVFNVKGQGQIGLRYFAKSFLPTIQPRKKDG